MALPNIKSFGSKAGAALMGATLALSLMAATNTANAQEPENYTQSSSYTSVYSTSLAAGGAAAIYSEDPNTVAVIVYYGQGVNPAEYGDVFASQLIKRGVKARSFAAPLSIPGGVSIAYQIDADGLGPMPPKEAADRINEAIDKSQARDRVLYSNYTSGNR